MMDDPWFVLYKGPGKRQITPANAKGWGVVAGFVLMTMLPTPLLILFVEETPWVTVPLLAWILLVTVGFLRFARARAEVIDIRQDSADWREFQAWRDEKRRRGRP